MESSLWTSLRELWKAEELCNVSVRSSENPEGGVRAHQAVLAAASATLCNFFASSATAPDESDGPVAPQPIDLQLAGLSKPAATLSTLIGACYGEPPAVDEEAGDDERVDQEDLRRLCTAWNLPMEDRGGKRLPSIWSAGRICSRLREMRAQGLLCDIVVIVGERRFLAHQCLLAAASSPLRKLILDKLAEVSGNERRPLLAQPLELELEGCNKPEAMSLALDCLYGTVPISPPACLEEEEVATSVRHLANLFALPTLQGLLPLEAQTVRSPKLGLSPAVASSTAPGVGGSVGRLSKAQVIRRLSKTRALSAKKPTATSNQQAASSKPAEEEAEVKAESPDDADSSKASPKNAPKPTKLEEALYSMKYWGFNAGMVPEKPSEDNGQEANLSKPERRILKKLQDLFEERAVWLERPLCQRLPSLEHEEGRLLRLLAFVAYQWTDGPWQKCYSRLGYDPRCDPEEGRTTQVIQFRDPHFKPEDKNDEEDPTFKKPPSDKVQFYQYIDIDDDFVVSMINESEPLEEVDKKTGWLENFIPIAIKDRLCLKSQELRQKLAQKAANKAAASKGKGAAGARAGAKRGAAAAGSAAKRAKGGG